MPAEKRSGRFAGLSRDTFLLALASLFADISTEMLYPVLPIFLTQTLHAGGGILGVVEGVAGATQNLAQAASGAISDRLRRRKGIALAGFALAALAKPLIGFAAAWPAALAGRFLDRLASGARSAPRDALVAASADPGHRGKAFGLEGAGDNAGAFLGPLLALLLLSGLGAPLRLVFVLAIIPGLLAFLMILLVHDRPAPVAADSGPDGRRLPPAYWRYLAATVVFGIGNSSNAFLILRTRDLGASLSTTILIYAGFNLVAALVSYPAGWLSDRLGRRGILLGAFAIFFATYLGFAISHGALSAAVLFILYGAFQGIFRAVGKSLASDFAPEAVRASAIGWYGAAVGLSGLAASLVAGQLWDRVGHSAVFAYGAVCAALGMGALVALTPRRVPAD